MFREMNKNQKRRDTEMKKLLAILLALVMVLSIAACGEKPADPTKAPEGTKAPSTQTPDATNPPAVEDDEPTVVKLWRSSTAEYYIQEDNATWQMLHQYALDEANVDLQIEYFDWGDNYQQKLMMYCTDGSLPAGIYLWNTTAFYKDIIAGMGAEGWIFDWAPYANDAANYPNLNGNPGDFLAMHTAEDGTLYGYPTYISTTYPHAPGGVSVRKDWLIEQGLEYPTNEDELYEVIKAFTAYTPTPVNLKGFDNFDYWLNHWLGTSMWTNESGEWHLNKWGNIDGLTKALTFLNKLWNEGLLDKESFSQEGEAYLAKGANSEFGVTSFTYSYGYQINESLFNGEAADSNKYIVSVPSFSANPDVDAADVAACEFSSTPVYWAVCVKGPDNEITDEDFAKIAKAVDWIGSYEANRALCMGFEGYDWEYTETGAFTRTEEYKAADSVNKAHQYNCGLCLWSEINTNGQAMGDLLSCLNTAKSDIDSCANIVGHQIGRVDAMNTVTAGEVETDISSLISDAWGQMVIAAISAPSEAECAAIVAAWETTLYDLGYQDIIDERIATCEAYGLDLG